MENIKTIYKQGSTDRNYFEIRKKDNSILFVIMTNPELIYELHLTDKRRVNCFKSFLENEIDYYVLDQFMLTRWINRTYQIKIGNEFKQVLEFKIVITDDQNILIQNELTN